MGGQKISAAQFFAMMFAGRAALTLALNARYAAGENLLDGVAAYLVAMGGVIVLSLPLAVAAGALPRRANGRSCGRPCRPKAAKGVARTLLAAGGICYFVGMEAASLGVFRLFLEDAADPGFPPGWAVAALGAAATFGAWKGLEAVARCGACVLVLQLAAGLGVCLLAVGRFHWGNLQPPLQNGWEPVAQGAGVFLSRTSLVAEMAVLLPWVKGRKGLGFSAWVGGTSLLMGGLLVLLAGCLGPYAYTRVFPVYALAALPGAASGQRLDAAFTGVWMTGLVIQGAGRLCACRACAAALVGEEKARWAAPLAAGAAVALATVGAAWPQSQALLLNTGLWLAATLAAGIALPWLTAA